jgi:hypothetical protein
MKMNAGVWIGLAGGLIGIIVAVGSVLAVGGSSGIYIAGGIIAVFGGMMLLFYKLFFGPMINASRLAKTGIPGKATIKEVRDTGVTINNSPQVKLVLDVKNQFGQIYSTTIRTLVSRLQPNLYQPGMVVPVKIDPKNENNVIIDFSAAPQQTAMQQKTFSSVNMPQADAVKDELMKLQQDGDMLRLTGRSARAIVKKYTWLGVYVNGNNPYAEMELEVLPDDGPAFQCTAKGAIGEQSVAKYQPGQEVYVKYDPADKTKVALDHS